MLFGLGNYNDVNWYTIVLIMYMLSQFIAIKCRATKMWKPRYKTEHTRKRFAKTSKAWCNSSLHFKFEWQDRAVFTGIKCSNICYDTKKENASSIPSNCLDVSETAKKHCFDVIHNRTKTVISMSNRNVTTNKSMSSTILIAINAWLILH